MLVQFVFFCATSKNRDETSRVHSLRWTSGQVYIEIAAVDIQHRIRSHPASEGNPIAPNAVRLVAVFGVPLCAGEAAGVGDVFGRAAILTAEGLVGVRAKGARPFRATIIIAETTNAARFHRELGRERLLSEEVRR